MMTRTAGGFYLMKSVIPEKGGELSWLANSLYDIAAKPRFRRKYIAD